MDTEIKGLLDASLDRYAKDRSDNELRDRILNDTDWLAVRAARRYAATGEPFDDLLQVARLGLIKALQRYDPTTGVPFAGYAMPTMLGELRRHFRDYTWRLHVPRSAKERRPLVNECVQALSGELGRAPRVDEIAARLGLSEEAIVEALDANQVYTTRALDHATPARLAVADCSVDSMMDRQLVATLLKRLPERERKVLYLRFYEELSQTQIAERIGTSQVHAGRIIATALARLRTLALADSECG